MNYSLFYLLGGNELIDLLERHEKSYVGLSPYLAKLHSERVREFSNDELITRDIFFEKLKYNFIPKEGKAETEYGEMLRALDYLYTREFIFNDAEEHIDEVISSYIFVLDRWINPTFSIKNSFEVTNINRSYNLFCNMKLDPRFNGLIINQIRNNDKLKFDFINKLLNSTINIAWKLNSVYKYLLSYDNYVRSEYNMNISCYSSMVIFHSISLLDEEPLEASR